MCVAVTPAYAADGDVHVVNTETVQVYTSPTGEAETRRVYEQLALTGHGTVDLRNPISTDHLRNLDGFSGVHVEDGEQVTTATVDGEKKLRSVSTYDGDLPLHVSVAYKLDGKNVEPGDVVGKNGRLEVRYTVENVTGKPQQVTFPDGHGGTVTKTVDVPVPMVGSLSTVAPPSFTNVRSDQANMAGDGKGGTKLSFTMTLFPPIGSTTAVFGYTADITDGVVPRAEISALPVNPLQSPSFKTAASSYQGGADTGAELTDGATQIDTNLLKLRDGAATLLAGLLKLRDGAGDLQAGLAGQAVPGSKKLAAGAGDLSDGLGRLNSGARRLAAGNSELSAGADQLGAGTTKASAGSRKLAHGTGKLSRGAKKLSAGASTVDGFMKQIASGQGDLLQGLQLLEAGVQALPTTVNSQIVNDPNYKALLAALKSVSDGIGTLGDSPAAGTILGGLNGIQYGMRFPGPTDCGAAAPQHCGAADGVDYVKNQFAAVLAGGPTDAGSLANLKATILSIKGTSDCGVVCQGTTDAIATGIESALRSQLTSARDGLGRISQGIDQGIVGPIVPGDPTKGALNQLRAGLSRGDNQLCLAQANSCGIKQGVDFIRLYGIPALVDGVAKNIRASLLDGISAPAGGCTATSKTLICGAQALATGGTQLAGGTEQLVGGAGDLSDGAALLNSKTHELSSGLGRIDDGAQRLVAGGRMLAAGSAELANGAAQADDGGKQVAGGASDLSDGLGDAADGSGRLAAGLGKAASGAPKLVNGAQRLSDEGTKKLIGAGKGTAQNYGELYATMKAGAERADAEDMAYGAPDDAIGLTAYNYIIKGDDGESGRNLARGLAGLAVLGAGGGVFALRRRLV
jgi:putative membrane protein